MDVNSFSYDDELDTEQQDVKNNNLFGAEMDEFFGFPQDNENIEKPTAIDVKVNIAPAIEEASKKPSTGKKRGRPRKIKRIGNQGSIQAKLKTDVTSSLFEMPPKKKRGRPKKNISVANNSVPDSFVPKEVTPTSLLSVLEIKSPRSCKRSVPWEEDHSETKNYNDISTTENPMFPKKKRGRPRKNQYSQIQNATNTPKRMQKVPNKYSDSSMMFKRKYRKMNQIAGRPKKHVIINRPSAPVIGRKRGRPRKEALLMKPEVHFNGFKENAQDTASPDQHQNNALAELFEASQQIHAFGWSPGNSGGVSILNHNKIYTALNQQENYKSKEFSCYDLQSINTTQAVKDLDIVFVKIHEHTKAGAVVHSRSDDAVLASLLFKGSEFRITHQEMICEIHNSNYGRVYKFDDILVIPILQNTVSNEELSKHVVAIIGSYPDINAVLIRRRGIYVWSNSIHNAIAQTECYHNLFRIAIKMRQIGIEPDQYPRDEYGLSC